ncbi:MAG TPA: NADP-dependent phosphogluconate dehydrogenase [Candidatus Nitrosotalea sp.]|nr:NADP-dependent phosphogluconate dehydrogenase [Candidatus Nitrosotalea sp.]
MSTAGADFGVYGLAVMGQNLARNMAHKGFTVAVYNRTPVRTQRLMAEHGEEGRFTPAYSVPELVAAIARPRPVLLMVQAGDPVDQAIAQLLPHLESGDIVIDAGNSHFLDTRRRESELSERGIMFVGTGVSGGEEGALNGPSIMPGGAAAAYERVAPVFLRIAAQVDGQPCCTHIGPDGAGHYVKMVHNGIEYADIQLIAEAYDLMTNALGMTAPEIASIFEGWNQGELGSYLIEISAQVLAKTDAVSGRPLVDVIVDEAAQKGTGKWTSQSALDLGSPVTAITEAVFARFVSAQRGQRIAAAGVLSGPRHTAVAAPDDLVDSIGKALYASKVVAYAQGFDQMRMAAREYGWRLDPGAIASIWRGGCIIRARFLDRIKEAYDETPDLDNLMLAPYFTEAVTAGQTAWRSVVKAAIDHGVPTAAFSSALAYYDGYRRARGPANLIQGLRDYFGAHTYRRLDRDPGQSFHTRWGQDGAEVDV